jgi:iron complex transport system ATP-binding protein
LSIEVKNLSFGYDERLVLDGINFTIPENRLVSILGPNGVGKSTLFNCILGLLKGYTGQIFLNGRDVKTLSIKEMAKTVAFIPQSHNPSFNFSVADIVLMGTTVQVSTFARPGKHQVALVDAALEKIGISHLRERGYNQISGGERQLVLLARALVQEAKILILDEPTANLDYGNQIRVLMQIQSLTREGYTIIQSTHNPDQTFLFSDTVLAMKGGKIVACGVPGDIYTEELIRNLYAAEVKIQSLYEDRVRVSIPKCAI